MTLRARTLALAAVTACLAACGADKSNSETGSATGTGASSDAASSSSSSGGESTASTSASAAPTSSTGAPEPASTGDATVTSEGNSSSPGEPDAGSGLECDIAAEDCPAGQKCMPYARDGDTQWNAFKCVPIDPDPVGVGEACTAPDNGLTGVDNCDKHVICWDVKDDMGACVAMCEGYFCVDRDKTCYAPNDALVRVCLPTCYPLEPDCPPGQTCQPIFGGGVCVRE